MSEPEFEPRREASLSGVELPASAGSRLLRPAPAFLCLSVVLGLVWWGAWHRGHDRDPRRDGPIDESVATAWSPGVVLIPAAPPPASPAERLEARLSAFARHVERIRASIDPPLVAFGSEALREELEQVIARVDDRAQVSVHIRDIDSGRVLFDYYGDTLLNPASNLKLLTTSAALDLLGPDYVFETRVLRVGETLYLVGEGDPTIDAEALAGLTKMVAERVPTTTVSEIVVDDSAFSPRVFGPGYFEGGWGAAYMAPSGALSVNFNTVEVTVHRAGGTKLPVVRLEPQSAHVIVDNRATFGSRTRLEIRSHSEAPIGIDPPGREQILTRIEIEGSLAKSSRGYKVRRRIVDPGMFTGGAFAQMLAGEHVSEPLPVRAGVAPRVEKPTPDAGLPRIVGRDAQGRDIWLIAERRSPPLLKIVSGVLSYSNNFMAEQILRTLGWRMTGDPGGWENGGEVVRGYWAALGNDPGALVYENGSGLSSAGRVTTTGLVDLMAVAARTQSAGSSLIDALPVAGADGTVRTRLRRSGKRVRAKTGTLAGVSGLTGVITTDEGVPQVAFSILINVRDTDRMAAATRRKTEDAIVMTVLDHIDGWEMIRGTLVTDLPPLSVTPE